MKKVLRNLLLAICILCVAVCVLGACKVTDDQTNSASITIADITVGVGKQCEIEVSFQNCDEQQVVYEFNGNDISIVDGKVTGITAGSVTQVTAKTKDGLCQTTFNITVKDLGTLFLEDVELKVGEQITLSPKFSKPGVNESVTYNFEGDSISIVNGVLKGLKEGTVTVTATSENHTATFTVTVTDIGTLSFDDVYMFVNSSYTIVPKFSKEGYSEKLVYIQNHKLVSIEDGVITATKAGSTVITAKSANFTVDFNVTVIDIIDEDEFIVFTDYMITLYPNPNIEGTVTLTTDDTDIISIDGNNVKGLTKGTATVKATCGDLSKDITIDVRSHDMATDEGNKRTLAEENDRLKSVMNGLESFVYTKDELVLFAGDSFMDERWFITDFYTTRFATKNAYTVGISSSRASAWIYMMQNFYEYSPKAIVLHIGTNDLFDGNRSADSVFKSIKTLLAMSHDNMPETEIYWWTIEQRIGQESWNSKIKTINNNVIDYAKDKDWLKVVDTYTAMSQANGDPDSSLYGDSVHPACPAGYDKLIGLTYDAGLVITDSPLAHGVAQVKTWTTAQADTAGSAIIMPLTTGNYLFHTDITILSYANNAHITIPFESDNNRLLIWNSGSDGKFYYGAACNGTYYNSSIDYLDVANGTKTASVDILVYNNNAYMFVDGKLESSFIKLPSNSRLKIGTENCSVKFENTVVYQEYDLGLEEFNKIKNDNQIAALFGTSTEGILLSNASSLPSVDKQMFIDCQGYVMVGEEAVELKSGNRDRWFVVNGDFAVSGDFAFSFDFERTNTTSDIAFLGLNFSEVGSYNVWSQYHLFYQKSGDTFKVHSDYGSKSENPNYGNIPAGTNKMTCYIVRKGNTVLQAYYINEHYAASIVTYDKDSLALWISIEGMTGSMSKVAFESDSEKVTKTINDLTCAIRGHDWDGGVVQTEPTGTEAGSKLYTCNCCGETKTESYTCDHVWTDSWSWNGDVPTLTLTCTLNNEHTLILIGDALSATVSKEEGKWGCNAAVSYNGTTYQQFKAYEDIYKDLVIAPTETVGSARYFKTTGGAWLFSAKIDVSGVKVENNVHLQFGKDLNLYRILVWSNGGQSDFTVHSFGYELINGSNFEITDGAASFTVKIVASNAKMFFFVNDNLLLTYDAQNKIDWLANWKDLLIGGEGGATWNFSDVIFEGEDGANYQAFINEMADGKLKMSKGTKTQLSDINAEYANAQYAEVTIYEPYGDMVTNSWTNHTIGIQLGVADKDGNEVYGFGSWHFGPYGYLLAWQQTAQSGTETNDFMWRWMNDLGVYNAFSDLSKGVKISVAIIEGDVYAFWSIDGGTTWTKFIQDGGALNNINEKVPEPASISYIFCGVDGFYSDLSASATVPENILALVA